VLEKINPAETEAWGKLKAHYQILKNQHMKELFQKDPKRFGRFSLQFEDILIDFSKNIITDQTFEFFVELAEELKLKEAVEAMFTGGIINETEHRPVLHTALRNRYNVPVLVDGEDVMPEINRVLEKMKLFTDQLATGIRLGYTGQKITDIVNIGIGGSDLGPVMVTEALMPYRIPGLNLHFISNIDGTNFV
jgi:glucose-6-phosphate isomerase